MAAICADCPLTTQCALHALSDDIPGGFYAGVWLPWPTAAASSYGSRRSARAALRRVVTV